MTSTMLTILASLLALATNADTTYTYFMIMADWGGTDTSPYTTQEEVASANIMSQIAEKYDITAVAGLGDNFYYDGVVNQYDARFQETFEDCFNQDSLSDLPFYMVAGNHDHNGNVSGEIYYSNDSSRWIFPDYYYSVTFDIGNDKTFQLIMIDTVTFSGQTDDVEYCTKYNIPMNKCRIHPEGASNKILRDSQYDWLVNQLNNSVADFLFIAGHYPVYSIAEHGSTKELVNDLIPLMKQYNTNGYISGHDHTFEYIIDPTVPQLVYIDTGGTHLCDPSTEHTNTIPDNSLLFHDCNNGGFTLYKFETGDEFRLKLYYYFGNSTSVQYEPDPIKPRNSDYIQNKKNQLGIKKQPLGIVTSTN